MTVAAQLQPSHAAEASWLADELLPKLPQKLLQHLVAHRGFHCPLLSDQRPLENTQPALQLAWEAGLKLCECDVRLTADGELLLLHDDTLERLAPAASSDSSTAASPTDSPSNELQSSDSSTAASTTDSPSHSPARDSPAHELLACELLQPEVQLARLEDVLQTGLETGGRLVIELKEDPGVGKAVARLLCGRPELMAAVGLVMSFEVAELIGFSAEFKLLKEIERPTLLMLTCIPSEGLTPDFKTLDLSSPGVFDEAEDWLMREDLDIDGFYIEWTPQLVGEQQEAFERLCKRCTMGVWQYHGQTDSVEEAMKLVQLGASFCNTDLPSGFN